jgi:hypothetical protein
VSKPSLETAFWEEMCRREGWDREYEQNIPQTDQDKKFMEEQKEKEDELRNEWDLNFHKLHVAEPTPNPGQGNPPQGTWVANPGEPSNKLKWKGLIRLPKVVF